MPRGRGRHIMAAVLCPCILALCVLWISLACTAPLPLLQGLSFSQQVQDRHGNLLRLGLSKDEKFRVFTPLHGVAPEAVQATLLYEDRYFYQHMGINPLALARSAYAMLQGTRRMGGSTLTMQVARLRYQLTTSTPWGKLVQMYRALHLEYHYSKQDILEAYFNLAPYGANIEGIGAAAQIYFHHAAGRLTLSESLALAAVPQNPVKRSPLQGKDFNAARQRMHGLWQQHSGGVPSPDALPPLRMFGPSALPFKAPHVSEQLLQAATLATPTALRTTLDSGLQDIVEGHIRNFSTKGRPYGLHNAAALLVHWPSMEIRALVGSADFHNTDIAGQVDGTRARRSPGSTLKPFIYALALDQGLIHPQSMLIDSPHNFGEYTPENFDRAFSGPLPAHQALRSSRNIPAIWLAARLRPDLYTLLRRAHVQLSASREHYGLSLVLGGAEVTMRELAALYAMLPNKGLWQNLRLLQDDPRSPAQALLSPEAAIVSLRMLETPQRSAIVRHKRLPQRYKTGTSNRFRDAWTVGIVGPYVLVIWVGNFDNSPNPLLIGGEVAAPLYIDMAQSLKLHENLTDLIPQQQEGLNIIRIPMCTDTGDIDVSLCTNTTENWYIPGLSPTQSSGVYRRIMLDKATGLRACPPTGQGGTAAQESQEIIWEFWPSDIQELYRQAGITKAPPPPFLPHCGPPPQEEGTQQNIPPVAGQAPRILLPREGVRYQRSLSNAGRGNAFGAIPLRASADADAQSIFWFVGSRYVGSSKPDAVLLWQPTSGVHSIRAVDNRGRASLRRVSVEAVP